MAEPAPIAARRRTDLFVRGAIVALLAGIAAQATFAALQWRAIARFAAIAREFSATPPNRVSPDALAREYFWYSRASGVLQGEGGNPYNVLGDLARVLERRSDLTVQAVAGVVLFGVLGGAGLAWLLSLWAGLSRRIPIALPPDDRRAVVTRAIGLSAGWAVVSGALAAAVAWHAGFDRTGMYRSLLAGLVPTGTQFAGALALWTALSVAGAASFLLPAACALFGKAPPAALMRCPRCRYAMPNAWPGRCPECGTDVSLQRDFIATPAGAHARHGLRVPVLLLGAGALAAGVGAASPGVRDWLRMRSPTLWIRAGELAPEGSLSLTTPYGPVRVAASRTGAEWTVRWDLHPRPSRHIEGPLSGALRVPDQPRPVTDLKYFTFEGLPFGPLRLFRQNTLPGLVVDAPEFDVVDR